MPEKDSKTQQKPSIFYKIKQKYLGIKKDFLIKIANIKSSPDYKALKSFILEIILLGLLVTLSLAPFIGIQLLNIIFFGSGLWLLIHKILPEVRQLISSLQIVSTHNYR